MTTILVTGSNGQVGQELQAIAKTLSAFKWIWTDARTLDITDAAAVDQFFAQEKISYCLNCAAYTAVDKAETETTLAHCVNALGAENLAKTAGRHHCKLLHLSTDYVYHGQQNTPYKEGDPVAPQGVYASTKLAGDQLVLQTDSKHMVIRTSWVYSSFGHNFVKTMRRLGQERAELRVVYDQIGSPTYARDLAAAMIQIIRQLEDGTVNSDAAAGLFHYSNEGVASWYDFALAIFELSQIDCRVFPIETADYPTPASRPSFSLLHKGKIKSVFQLDIPHWRASLQDCLSRLSAK